MYIGVRLVVSTKHTTWDNNNYIVKTISSKKKYIVIIKTLKPVSTDVVKSQQVNTKPYLLERTGKKNLRVFEILSRTSCLGFVYYYYYYCYYGPAAPSCPDRRVANIVIISRRTDDRRRCQCRHRRRTFPRSVF